MNTASSSYFVEALAVGPLEVNCYIVGCAATKAAVLIDPAGDAHLIEDAVARLKANVTAILLTHGHYDHLGAVSAMKTKYGCPILIHHLDADCLTNPMLNLSALTGDAIVCPKADRLLEDGDAIVVGDLELKTLHTPGHTRGSVCFVLEKLIFGGDLLFYGSIGRTDLPGGSFEEIENSITRRIYSLPDDWIIYPGHGEPTSVGFEKKHNAFVRSST